MPMARIGTADGPSVPVHTWNSERDMIDLRKGRSWRTDHEACHARSTRASTACSRHDDRMTLEVKRAEFLRTAECKWCWAAWSHRIPDVSGIVDQG